MPRNADLIKRLLITLIGYERAREKGPLPSPLRFVAPDGAGAIAPFELLSYKRDKLSNTSLLNIRAIQFSGKTTRSRIGFG